MYTCVYACVEAFKEFQKATCRHLMRAMSSYIEACVAVCLDFPRISENYKHVMGTMYSIIIMYLYVLRLFREFEKTTCRYVMRKKCYDSMETHMQT